MENLSTNPSSRRSSFCFQEPSKYSQLFAKGARITPKDRVDSNIQAIKSLNLKISSGLATSYFFKYGSPQAENDHFKDVFKSFFVEIRGADPLVHKGAKSLVSQFGRYQDVARIEREGNFPTEKLLEELQEIVHSTHGLRKQLLATLQNSKYTIDKEWDLETRDTCFREFKGILPIAPLFPKCVEALADIVSKLLEIEWLNEDVRGIQVYTGERQQPHPIFGAESVGGISVEGVLHLVKHTVGDGSCALHALLGKETPWGFYLEDSRAKLLSKIRERIKEPMVQAALLNILKSHADAQNDASSNMLFSGTTGQSLKLEYIALKRDYEQQIAALKDSEAALWLQEINSLRDLILENVDRSLERYAGKSDEEIFDIVKGSGTYLRNVVANTREAFLNAVSEDKRTAINLKQLEVNTALDREDQAKVDFFSQKLFPQYLTVLQDDDFYLNTAELELIAKLFNKNMRVIDRSGKLITAVNIPGLQEAPVIIYHEGVHFSRCKPGSEADPLELEAYKSQAEWNEIQELVGHTLIRDGQLKTLHGIESKKEAYSLIAAGVLSIWLGGVPLAIQAARSGINVVGRKVDPEGKDKRLQVVKMLSNSAVGKFIGGGGNLAASLGIDLVDILSRPENQNKTTSSIRNLIASSLKGLATRDPKKFAEYFMGGVVGEAANRLPENDANTSHVAGVFKAFAQNPELHGKLVEGALKKVSRSDLKPKTGGTLTPEEQEKYPKQIITEVEPEQPVKIEMQNESLYLKLVEEQKQNQVDLNLAQADCEAKRKAAEKASKEEHKLHEKNKGFKLIPKPKKYQEWLDSKKTLATKTGEYQTSLGHVSEIQEKIYNNSKAQLVASSPKVPTTQTDKGLAVAITNLNRIDREIPKKILAIEKSIDNYNEHYRKDSYFSEVKRTIKDLNSSLQERDTEQNNINKLNGVESNIQTPLIAIPDKASALAKVILWCKDNIVLGIHPPQQPFNYDPNKPIPPESNKGSIYHETRHQINLEQSELNVLEEKSRPVSQGSNWSSVSYYHSQRMFETNMAYHSPVDTSSQGNLDYQQFWGQGLANNVQIPPSDWDGLGRNDPEHRIPGMKHYPDGDRTQSNIPKWLRYFASGGEPIDPQERINTNTQSLVATAKAVGQAFGEIADELRSFGCVNAKFDQGKVTLRFDRTISSQIDGLMDQFLPSMDHVPNFRYVEFTARIANDIMLQAFLGPFFQAQRAKPLLDRVLVRPQGFGQQVRVIEAFQQPALRSGLGFPKMGLMPGQHKLLAERNISKIRTDWVFPKKGGARINGRWYTEHALERMAPRTPEVMAELEVRALNRAAKEGCLPQTKEFGRWMEKHHPDPRNIPPSVVEAEIAKPGSTSIRVELNNKGDVITVMPRGKK